MVYKIFFLGLNNETLNILSENKSFKILGVNYFDYFNDFSINPLDKLFQLIYRLHFNQKNRRVYLCLFVIWEFFSFFSSKIFKINKQYLKIILNDNIKVINTEDVEVFKSYLINNNIDLLIINSWGIIPNEILYIPQYHTINIHPSLLPKYKGALPTLWSLKNHDESSALSYLVLSDEIDSGLIIGQHIFEILDSDNWLSLEKKISLLLKNTLNTDLMNYLNGSFIPVKELYESSYTDYYDKYRKIDLSTEYLDDIYNKAGLYPYIEPFVYCYISLLDRNIYIKKMSIYKRKTIKDEIGLINIKNNEVLFYVKNGILKSRLFLDISMKDSLFIIFNKILKKL